MPKSRSIADVFIVESLEFKYEKANRLEENFLSHLLHLGKKNQGIIISEQSRN